MKSLFTVRICYISHEVSNSVVIVIVIMLQILNLNVEINKTVKFIELIIYKGFNYSFSCPDGIRQCNLASRSKSEADVLLNMLCEEWITLG